MRFASIAAGSLLLITIPASATQGQQAAKGSLAGTIVNSVTGNPVAGAQVAATSIVVPIGLNLAAPPPSTTAPAQAPPRPEPIPPATTSGDGAFLLKDLNAGSYRITVTANGYARQEYGQRAANAPGTPIPLDAGANVKGLVIRLTPTGAVSGHISDEAGAPATDVPVQLLRVTYNQQGKTMQAAGTTNANDRGEFRLYGIAPGRYYLNAGNGPGPLRRPGQPGAVLPGGAAGPNYAFTYFPGVTDLSQAVLIDVKPGGEFTADMRVARQPLFRVRGRVIDSRTGQPPPAASISLNYRNITGGSGSFSNANSYDGATGNFAVQNVIPGPYVIQAQIQESRGTPLVIGAVLGNSPDALAAAKARPTGSLPINVTDDLEGLVVRITNPLSIPGRITVEGGDLSSVANLDRIRVALESYVDGVRNPGGPNPRSLQMGSDGSFQLDGLREGEYKVSVSLLPVGFYVKRAELDGADVLNDVLKFTDSTSGTLNVVLRSGTGQISGVVTDARNEPVPSIQAVLVPAQRNRMDLYRTGVTDRNGRFTMSGVTPGNYKLFSWEAAEPNIYYDPDFLARYEGQGASIRLAESAQETKDIKIIPAEK